jgi:hypothetical protein
LTTVAVCLAINVAVNVVVSVLIYAVVSVNAVDAVDAITTSIKPDFVIPTVPVRLKLAVQHHHVLNKVGLRRERRGALLRHLPDDLCVVV